MYTVNSLCLKYIIYPVKAWSGFCFYAISTLMSFIYLVSVIEKVENEDLTDDALAIYKSRFTNHQSPEYYDHRDNLELKCFSDILGKFSRSSIFLYCQFV